MVRMSDEHDLVQKHEAAKKDEISGRKRDTFYARLSKAAPDVELPAQGAEADEDPDDER